MKALKVTSEWLDWFHRESIQLITTVDNRETFTKIFEGTIQDSQLNYDVVLKLIDIFKSVFSFLEIDNIRLVWCERLEKDNLQFYKNISIYKDWMQNILDGNYEFENFYGGDYEDSSDIYYNYCVSLEGKTLPLYQHKQTDRAAFYLWYNPQTRLINFKINIELRSALFIIDRNFEVQLPSYCLEHNTLLLSSIEEELVKQLKAL